MVWLLLLAGAIAARILLAQLRKGEPTPWSRALLFEFGAKRALTDAPPSRTDRLWTGSAQVVGSIALLGAAMGFFWWSERWTLETRMNHVLSGIGFVFFMLAFLVGLAGLIELVRAPFSPRRVPRP